MSFSMRPEREDLLFCHYFCTSLWQWFRAGHCLSPPTGPADVWLFFPLTPQSLASGLSLRFFDKDDILALKCLQSSRRFCLPVSMRFPTPLFCLTLPTLDLCQILHFSFLIVFVA